MKLEKAIEILTKWRDKGEGDGEELEEAENLGIEALKVLDGMLPMFRVGIFSLLPGESTQEVSE